ncbi:hypothetical protein BOV90_02140 [Solemya velum gill symbiont]|uniref:AMMECR1 domain-containing protein n=2 Tax=Solemya velum gill symbiont TaxID=2340 RepID=A0A1T2DJK7_SOVGS|nr:AmmeMemoRadiSam system protein A [Solemya velum gill symbiont]OOY34248.1 hypothetical protein BOV88_11160 [Solemya velum gill symbiont]OOY36947.1 hypothetical protein BOV89_10050 [Solemya velum gill symbiont]OOY40839.1 hypothetical protein BOV90_02140 [Solemya velum gill symbiont]OOY46732.1 hypothetical protein BOV93_09180 [Solemya velum gill symbiont]OOY47223.1 hypothetical protein BOV92_01890 [Solemya velum gill symbiont]
MHSFELTSDDKSQLLVLARQSINHYLSEDRPLQVDATDYSANLQQLAASFVTLHLHKQLRGCIGALEAYQPLVTDVVEHARGAAFQDPRFNPISKTETNDLEIEISVLTPSQQIEFQQYEQLLEEIRPGTDGLIIQQGFQKATFLPSVWEQLPDPRQFLHHLMQKAGILSPVDGELQAWRYETLKFSEKELSV